MLYGEIQVLSVPGADSSMYYAPVVQTCLAEIVLNIKYISCVFDINI